MRAEEFIDETHTTGEMPAVDNEFIHRDALLGATKIKDVSATLSLYQKNNWISLVKFPDILVGSVKLTDRDIAGSTYSHIDIIHIFPEYRNTSAIKWLLYAVKESAKYPVVADGVIFKQGQQLIDSLMKHNWMHTFVLNKISGEITKYKEPIIDINSCYLFEPTKEGFAKIIEATDPHDAPMVLWVPIFESFEQ